MRDQDGDKEQQKRKTHRKIKTRKLGEDDVLDTEEAQATFSMDTCPWTATRMK